MLTWLCSVTGATPACLNSYVTRPLTPDRSILMPGAACTFHLTSKRLREIAVALAIWTRGLSGGNEPPDPTPPWKASVLRLNSRVAVTEPPSGVIKVVKRLALKSMGLALAGTPVKAMIAKVAVDPTFWLAV